jgi:hypothetical protein
VNAEASEEDQQVLSVHRVTALTAEQPPAADEDVAVLYAPYVKKQTSWSFDPEDVLRRVRARTSSAPSAATDDAVSSSGAAPVSSAGAMEVTGGEEDVFTVDMPAAAIPGQDRLQARILHKKVASSLLPSRQNQTMHLTHRSPCLFITILLSAAGLSAHARRRAVQPGLHHRGAGG